MNFTREPIIETVITPREGCKLVVRNSKGSGQEDYFVDAVEVVSFGRSFFFRSIERPKAFLVPVSDYEILELKETRMVLKNVATERSIKIGGGRDAPFRPQREPMEEPEPLPPPPSAVSSPEKGMDRRRDKRRRSRRGGRDRLEPAPSPGGIISEEGAPSELASPDEPKSFISKLFPPPPTLIKETLSRYKPPIEPEERLPSSEEEVPFEDESSLFDSPIPRDEEDDEDTQFEN